MPQIVTSRMSQMSQMCQYWVISEGIAFLKTIPVCLELTSPDVKIDPFNKTALLYKNCTFRSKTKKTSLLL